MKSKLILLILLVVTGTVNAKPLSTTGKSSLNVKVTASCKSENVKPVLEEISVTARKGKMLFAFTGEKLLLHVKIKDLNGGRDISKVYAILISGNKTIEVKLSAIGTSGCTAKYFGSYTIRTGDYGLYTVKVVAVDSKGLKDEKNAESIFLNPSIGVDVTPETINFGKGIPGSKSNVTVLIKNLDPDNVGMSLRFLVKVGKFTGNGNSFTANITCNNIKLSNVYSEIAEIPAKSSIKVTFELQRPIPLPAGDYTGELNLKFVT